MRHLELAGVHNPYLLVVPSIVRLTYQLLVALEELEYLAAARLALRNRDFFGEPLVVDLAQALAQDGVAVYIAAVPARWTARVHGC